MKKILIIGGRGTAVVIAEQIIDAIERFNYPAELIGFAFDDPEMTEVLGLPIHCHSYEVLERYGKYSDVEFIYQLYRPDLIRVRSELRESFNIPIERYHNFIHPSAYIAGSAKIGHGNVFLANTVVNSHAVIGNHNTFNSGDLIGHDTIIGDSNFSAAQVCIGSGLKIGDMNFFGLNSSLRNEIHIGNECIVGMASNVTKSLHDNAIVYGNPAVEKDKLNNKIR